MMPRLDVRAIITGLFLPMVYWTGAVIAITAFGYPGIVCMTPLAWLLALPVGLRIGRESPSPDSSFSAEAALSGAFLGLWQGGLFGAVVSFLPTSPASSDSLLGSPALAGIAAVLVSMPVTAGLSLAVAWAVRHRKARRES